MAETRLREKLVCSKCYREFERSSILWCGQCNHDLVCYTCGDQHVETTEHEVGGLCDIHERLLTRYCKTCRRLICDVCERSIHSGQGHDVVEYRDVIAETLKSLKKHINETGNTQFTALVEQITQVSEFRDETVTEKMRLCNVINEVYGTDSGSIDEEIMIIKAKIVDYQQQIKQFTQDCQQWIEQLRQDMKDAQRRKMKTDREFKKKKVLLDQLEEDFGTNLKHIDAALTEMKATEEQLRSLLGRATLMAKEKLLAPKILEDIRGTRHELDELVVAAEQDRITPLKEMAGTSPRCCMTEEYIRLGGLFSKATLSHEMNVQAKGFYATGVVFMSVNVLAVCGGTERPLDGEIGVPFKLMLLDIISDKQTIILNGNTVLNIKKLNEDDVVVLIREYPILRDINVQTRVIQKISVNLSEEATDQLVCQLEVDESGRFIVAYGEQPKKHLVLIDGDGTVLQDIQVGDVTAFTLCRLTNMVFTCSFRSDIITSYHVHENRFTKITSVPHGVEGLRCRDICSGVLGDVYVIGEVPADRIMEATRHSQQMKVYQLELEENNRVTGLRALGGFTWPWKTYNITRCSVFTNNIAICSRDLVLVFTLKP